MEANMVPNSQHTAAEVAEAERIIDGIAQIKKGMKLAMDKFTNKFLPAEIPAKDYKIALIQLDEIIGEMAYDSERRAQAIIDVANAREALDTWKEHSTLYLTGGRV
jgi:hypothetical protein